MRIVSLTCSNTEIVCALGRGDYLVGVDDYSDYPADIVSQLPRVGPDLTIDIERVCALKPDLVLASLTVPGHEKVIEGLESVGLPYIAPEPLYLDDVYQDISQIGRLLDATHRAQQIVQQMQQLIQPVKSEQAKPSVLIQWWPKPVIAPGKLSWVEALIQAAGLSNPIGEKQVKSTPLTDKQVRELNPDAIAISWCGVQYDKYRPRVVYRNPLWQQTKFVQNRNVFRISEAYLGRPSPRLVTGFKELKNIAQMLNRH